MEFNSTLSNIKRASGARRTAISSVFMTVADEYAKTAQEQIDPNQLQVGQSVFNDVGEELIVVDDPEGTTNKVLMPAEEQGQPIPEVETVEDAEIQTSYNVTSPGTEGVQMAETAKKAQDDTIDWDEIETIVTDMKAFTRQKNLHGLTTAVEEMTNFILSYIEMPEDMTLPPMFARMLSKCIAKKAKSYPSMAPLTRARVANPPPVAKEGAVEVLPEFKEASQKIDILLEFRRNSFKGLKASEARLENGNKALKIAQVPDTSVYPDVLSFHEVEKGLNNDDSLNTSLEKDDPEMVMGESGFVDIMNDIKEMTDKGCEVVDVILTVGEKYPREQGERVLEEARKEGVL